MLSIVTDLVEIIGLYTVPSVTYSVVTLSKELAQRVAYRGSDFWERKCEIEYPGIGTRTPELSSNGQFTLGGIMAVYGDDTSLKNIKSHTLYRVVSRSEYGKVIWFRGPYNHRPAMEQRPEDPRLDGCTGVSGEPGEYKAFAFTKEYISVLSDDDDGFNLNIKGAKKIIVLQFPTKCGVILTERRNVVVYRYTGQVADPVLDQIIDIVPGPVQSPGIILLLSRGSISILDLRRNTIQSIMIPSVIRYLSGVTTKYRAQGRIIDIGLEGDLRITDPNLDESDPIPVRTKLPHIFTGIVDIDESETLTIVAATIDGKMVAIVIDVLTESIAKVEVLSGWPLIKATGQGLLIY